MEEKARAERERPVDSDQESSPVLPPLLHPPDNLQSHRITNFYIDTILRPDFGRRRKDGAVRDGNGLRDILRTEQLRAGKKSAKTGSPRQGGAGAADDRHPDSEGQRPDLRAATGAVKDGSQAGSAPAAKPMLWPAWVYCTRYSDRPSAGPRSRKPKKTPSKEDKRPRTAFTAEQLHRLKAEFQGNRYLTEHRRQSLAQDLGLNESQIKIWFQNKRAKIKKTSGNKNSLALHLMAQGLYNHATAKSDSE